MVFVAHAMKKPTHNNDNSDTWIELAAATANLVRYLQKDRGEEPNGSADKAPEENADRKREHERAVETGLRRIERFERGYSRNRP